MKEKQGIAQSLNGLARVDRADHRLGVARQRYAEAPRLLYDLGDRPRMAESLEGLALVEVGHGDSEAALRLLGAAAELRDALGIRAARRAVAEIERALHDIRRTSGSDLVALSLDTGARMAADLPALIRALAPSTRDDTRRARSGRAGREAPRVAARI